MPNANRTIVEENASDPFFHASPSILSCEPGRRPFVEVARRISDDRKVLEALQSIEFSEDDWEDNWEDKTATKCDTEQVLNAVLAGGDIGTSVGAFFDRIRTDWRRSDIYFETGSIGYSNDLFKREPFFGVVTPFHSASVAAAIRKRPDLLTLMHEWYRVFNALHFDNFPEDVPTDIKEAADNIVRDVLKFATFKKSRLPTMTAMVGQDIYQIRKRGRDEIDVLDARKIDAAVAGRQKFISTRGRFILKNLSEGVAQSASLLIRGNRVIGMGTDVTTPVNQIFERENLHNLFLVEHIFPTEDQNRTDESTQTRNAAVQPSVSDSENFDFWLDMPEEDNLPRCTTKQVPLTEEFFDLITEAVEQLCSGTRAILTAQLLITDTKVRIVAYDSDRLSRPGDPFFMAPKVDQVLLQVLELNDFEQEIVDIELAADSTIEDRLLSGCLQYLDFDESDRLDPVNEKMVEILVNAVREYLTKSPVPQDYQTLSSAIRTAALNGRLYTDAVRERQDAKTSSVMELQGD